MNNTAIDRKTAKTFIAYIESCLPKDEEAVQLEAAKSICELYEVFGTVIDVEVAFQILVQLAQNSGKPVYKFAALKQINKIAAKQPRLVTLCMSELETLITDPNRSVASLAISTLLKTCKEDQVEKLLKQISSYLPDLGIEFKIETIQSTAQLYHRLPAKSGSLLKFLSDCLKDDPNILFRESVVDTIIEICPSQRENALLILAEHIEDCEHAHIQTKILNFLALEGPNAKNPSSYIRFIYNRVNLEKAVIRAAAVSSLATFAHKVPALKANIILLLRKCLSDSDDEVRERAHFYISIFEMELQGDDTESTLSAKDIKEECEDMRNFLFDSDQIIDVTALE
jgi:coatomer subunit gamma